MAPTSNSTEPAVIVPAALEPVVKTMGTEGEMVRRLVRTHQDRLSNLSSNPKGMTHGDVQRDLTDCKRILSGDA
ncbi:MAG: hypothetical protein ACTSP0_09265 [Alphaproteobacteria bacterium]